MASEALQFPYAGIMVSLEYVEDIAYAHGRSMPGRRVASVAIVVHNCATRPWMLHVGRHSTTFLNPSQPGESRDLTETQNESFETSKENCFGGSRAVRVGYCWSKLGGTAFH